MIPSFACRVSMRSSNADAGTTSVIALDDNRGIAGFFIGPAYGLSPVSIAIIGPMSFPDSLRALVWDGNAIWGFLGAAALVLVLTPLITRLAPRIGGVDR